MGAQRADDKCAGLLWPASSSCSGAYQRFPAFISVFGYRCCMADQTVARLGSVASQRWGLVTTAQPFEVGVSRNQLTRMAASGVLERVLQGVYRFSGAPELEHELTFATWLALGGAETANERPAGVVAAGATAAELHGIGDLFPKAREFIVPSRKTTRLAGIRLRTRQLDAEDVTIVDQLPILTVESTIADLVEQWTDLSIVANAVRDAVDQARLINSRRLTALLAPLAMRHGYPDEDAFAGDLFKIAGIEPSGGR